MLCGRRVRRLPPDTAATDLLRAALRDKRVVGVMYLPGVKIAEGVVEAASVSRKIGDGSKSGVSPKLLQIAALRWCAGAAGE